MPQLIEGSLCAGRHKVLLGTARVGSDEPSKLTLILSNPGKVAEKVF